MRRFAFVALCLFAAACNRNDGPGHPQVPSPEVRTPWGDPIDPDLPDHEGNEEKPGSVCEPDPVVDEGAVEASFAVADDDGGPDIGDPGFSISATPEAFVVPQGGALEVSVVVTRFESFDEPIRVTVEGLPEGVTATELELGVSETCGTLTLSAAATAGSPTPKHARVRGHALSGSRSAPVAFSVRGEPGSLDRSFGRVAETRLLTIVDVVEQPDGKLLVTGEAESLDGPMVCRIESSGEPDLGFGTSHGCARVDVGALQWGRALLLLADGRILVAGIGEKIAIARFTPSGMLDTTFGDAGWTEIDAGPDAEVRNLLLVGGKVLVIGANGVTGSWAARLNDDGSLDAAFGTYGRIAFGDGSLVGAARLGDCGFVAATQTELHAFDWDGHRDSAFGGGAIALPLMGSESATFGHYVSAAGPGFVVAGAGRGLSAARVSAGGVSDLHGPVHGPDGSEMTSRGIIVGEGDTMIFGGVSVRRDGGYELALARRTAEGALDPTFGDGGVGVYGVGAGYGVEMLRDGRYVVFGTTDSSYGRIVRSWD